MKARRPQMGGGGWGETKDEHYPLLEKHLCEFEMLLGLRLAGLSLSSDLDRMEELRANHRGAVKQACRHVQ